MTNDDRFSSYRYWTKTRRLLPVGYRVGFARRETGHWHGGTVSHKGARCFSCKAKLRLVWDISVKDPKLPEMLRSAFPKISRLPLLYCFNCPQATAYQVVSDAAVKSIDSADGGGDETPYERVPAELPRRPVFLKRISSSIDGLLTLESELGFETLDSPARVQLSKFLRKDLRSTWDIALSQFGGLPPLVQGHWDIECPNPKCSAHGDRNFPFLMKELAVVERDCLTGFNWAYAPLAYHVCRMCGTIQGNFRCS